MKNIKVLFVDDEEEFVQLLAERARMRELGAEIALDGSEALAKLGEKLPDVMILDLQLPGIDGLTVLEQVKKKYPDVQVIIPPSSSWGKYSVLDRTSSAYPWPKSCQNCRPTPRQILQMSFEPH